MKKSDLISGKHIVELRKGSRLLVAGNFLPEIDGNRYIFLTSFTDDLRLNACEVDYDKCHADYDICKVYEIVEHIGLHGLADSVDTACKLIWERKPELSEAERVILENVDKKYKYIARDGYIETNGMLGELGLFENKPKRMNDYWSGADCASFTFSNLFKMVKWEDEEPTLISDLLEGKQ